MAYLICDLETAAHPDAPQWFTDPILPPANLRDPEKIAAAIAEKTAERDAKLGLDPDGNRIVALGWWLDDHDPVVQLAKDETEEAAALTAFWTAYKVPPGQQETRLVTFFGRQFDLPVLLRRSMYLGVPHPRLNLDRYRSPHLDVWDALTYQGALRIAHGLAFYGRRFQFGSQDKIDGADVAGLVAQDTDEAWKTIADHCLADLTLTRAIAERLGLLR